MNRSWVLLLSLSVSPLLLAQESTLVIPRSSQEMRKYLDGGNAKCPGCGVVSNIRRAGATGQSSSRRTLPPMPAAPDVFQSGPESEVQTVVIFSSGNNPDEWSKEPANKWLVTVRYDDGTFAVFDEDKQPKLSAGDRVQVVAGQVIRR
jgi:hypothetical protein